MLTVLEATVRTPPLLKRPPPEPASPVALLPSMVAPSMFRVPPLLNSAPPPLSASLPAAVFAVNEAAPSMVMVPMLFHRAPPSLPAVLLLYVPPVRVTLPAPETCNAPPLPGFGATCELSDIVTPENVLVELPPNSTAPPALFAVLPVNVVPVTVS